MSVKFDVGDERSAFVQAGYQVAGIMVTLAISIFGGIVTGKNFLVISVLSKNRNCTNMLQQVSVTPKVAIRD